MVSYNTIISFTNPQVRDTAHATGHFDTKIYVYRLVCAFYLAHIKQTRVISQL